MYKDHPVFETPKNKNSKVWRYMDFTKFVSLLEKESLYFTRADKFNDIFEGSYSKFNIQQRTHVYKKIPHDKIEEMSRLYKKVKEFIYINCWHLNDYESAAMWNLYLKSNEGIAIQSSFENLKESFKNYNDSDIFIGEVKYIDYNKDWLPEGNFFYPFLHKRKSFEHEQEIRAIFYDLPENGDFLKSSGNFYNGFYIPVDIEILIEKIYIAPAAPEWFKDLVKSITNKYKLKKEIIKSSLLDDPVF